MAIRLNLSRVDRALRAPVESYLKVRVREIKSRCIQECMDKIHEELVNAAIELGIRVEEYEDDYANLTEVCIIVTGGDSNEETS